MRLASVVVRGVFLTTFIGATVAAQTAGERQRDDGLAPANVSPTVLARRAAKAKVGRELNYELMSSMGAIAAGLAPRPEQLAPEDRPVRTTLTRAAVRQLTIRGATIGSADIIVHGTGGDVRAQSETTIASNPGGTVLVAGYNDFRGFLITPPTPFSLSGVARSTDGGATWDEVPVGQGGLGVLPSVTGGQVFGDPDVKWSPTVNGGSGGFVYSSIYVRPSDGLQGMCINVSSPDASSWSTPIEVGPTFITGAAADKEFIDVNPVTGRILMTWSNFAGANPADIMRTYSDDGGTTWAPAVTIGPRPVGGFTQSSIPRFLPGVDNATSKAYAVWRVGTAAGLRNVGFASSSDGGATWGAVSLITTDFNPEDQIPGVDRVNTSPSLAVDYTSGNIYVVYQRNNTVGTGDIALQVSTDGGVTSSPATLVNSDPGNDRAQFYPWVTVDQSTGKVHITWYDEGSEATGDLLEYMHTSSSNGGVSFSPPTPLFDHPFHAGYGNDTSQPNLGDYQQSIAMAGVHHAVAAATSVAPRFDEGQPTDASMFTPDSYYDARPDSAQIVPLRLTGSAYAETSCAVNGNIDPGESGNLTLTLKNYVGNLVAGAETLTGISVTLTTFTGGVTVNAGTSAYPDLAPLASGTNASPFSISVSPSFVAGTYIDFALTVTTDQGTTQLPLRLPTGSPGTTTTLINEDFEGVAPGTLPAGWTSVSAGGTAVPWTTSNTFTGSNAAFHAENTGTKFQRLFSPIVTVPNPAGVKSYVTLDFDIQYNLEDDPTRLVQAFDGLTLRITDQTSGQVLRSVLAEAFAETLLTGNNKHFPKHLPRSSNTAYFQDMSVWSGNSGGLLHVFMKFPGAGMVGRMIQLRFEYTEDSTAVCASGPCGVAVDNILLKHVVSTAGCPLASINDVSVTEGNAGTTNATFTVSLSPAPTSTVTVNYATADGTAMAPGDYTTSSGTLTFNAGETTKTLDVPVVGDLMFEPDETFFVNLTSATGAGILDNQGVGTILNDDPVPSIVISDVSQAEGNAGPTSFVFAVMLSNPSSATVMVDFATADGTATVAGGDYVANSGTVTFPPGATMEPLTVIVNGDTTQEPNETFFVNLGPATGATIADGQGVGTILNDDGGTPVAVVSGDATICPGRTTTIRADFTGATPVDITWSDGFVQNGVTSSPALRDVSPAVTTTYTITSISNAFGPGSASGAALVTVDPSCGSYYTVQPCRVVNTRTAQAPALGANTTRTFQVTGVCNVPSDAKAVAVIVTAADETDFGDLRLFPTGGSLPVASALNFAANHTRAGNGLIILGTGGQIDVRCDMPPGSTGITNFLMDVVGYFK